MPEVLEKAKQKLARLQVEMAELRTFIEVYERLSGGVEAPADDSGAGIPEPVANPAHPYLRTPPAVIVAAAKDLMLEKQRPLTRTDLVRLLTLRGLRLAGTDKSKNIGTIIWRSKQFYNIEGKGYWPKDAKPWREIEGVEVML
jgi:hypothetical protein